VLKQFQLQAQTTDTQVEICASNIDDWRATDMWREKPIGRSNLIGGNHGGNRSPVLSNTSSGWTFLST
jgi:hypothetical protein